MKNIFKRDYQHYEGVAPINIYGLRLLFTLISIFLTYDSLTYILNHKGTWEVTDAVAWCVWLGYGLISWIGIIRPLKMLPIILLEIVYKLAWLIVVSYPLWQKNELAGSPAEYTTSVFIFIFLPILFMPWKYFFVTVVLGRKMR